MSGTAQVGGTVAGIDGDVNGLGPVGGRDAGGDAEAMIRVDGDGERGPHRFGVLALHLLETQLVAPLVGQGETHPARERG